MFPVRLQPARTPSFVLSAARCLQRALGHDYKSEVTAPTCTEMGYTTNTCTRCGDTNKTDYTEPAGHKPGDWIIDKGADHGFRRLQA